MNIDCRPHKGIWTGIVIHHTGVGRHDPKTITKWRWQQLFKNIANYLQTKDKYYVSAHCIISREGVLRELVDPDKFVAWHAGKSSFWHPLRRKYRTGCNDFMLGIELLGDGNKADFSDKQYVALAQRCSLYLAKYKNIHPNCIVGHEMISPGRKVDPGYKFNWRKFYKLLYKF